MLEFVIIAIILLLVYFYQSGKYWEKLNVAGPSPIPFVGNMLHFVLAKKHFGEVYDKIYREYPNAAYVGMYRFMNQPTILIRDLDLIKDVLIRNFNDFHDNFLLVDAKDDPLAVVNPFVAAGENWKIYRSHIAQLFTANKIRTSFPLINNVCKKFEDYVSKGPDNQFNAFEAKSLCAKFTIEVIASCGFGLEGQTFADPNSDFSKFCEFIFVPNFWSYFHCIGVHFFAPVSKILQLPMIPENVQEWLQTIMTEVLRRRNSKNENRTDFLQVLMDTNGKNNEKIEEDVILGHCATLLLEGFETSSSLMAYTLYQLAINPRIQRKVQDEIDAVLSNHNRELTYDSLQEMKYLESVMLETLRMHPVMPASERISTRPTELPPQYPGQQPISIPVGTSIVIPSLAIHYDPEIYPNPHTFDPDRFSDEQQKQRHKLAYLAFGEGPRICVGMRFGLAQSKAGIATIMAKYNVQLSPKTKIPVEILPTTFLINAKGGIWVNFERRLRHI